MKNCILYPIHIAYEKRGHEDPMGFGDTPEEAIQDAHEHISAQDPDDYTLDEAQEDLCTVEHVAVIPDHDSALVIDGDHLGYVRDWWETLYFADPANYTIRS